MNPMLFEQNLEKLIEGCNNASFFLRFHLKLPPDLYKIYTSDAHPVISQGILSGLSENMSLLQFHEVLTIEYFIMMNPDHLHPESEIPIFAFTIKFYYDDNAFVIDPGKIVYLRGKQYSELYRSGIFYGYPRSQEINAEYTIDVS